MPPDVSARQLVAPKPKRAPCLQPLVHAAHQLCHADRPPNRQVRPSAKRTGQVSVALRCITTMGRTFWYRTHSTTTAISWYPGNCRRQVSWMARASSGSMLERTSPSLTSKTGTTLVAAVCVFVSRMVWARIELHTTFGATAGAPSDCEAKGLRPDVLSLIREGSCEQKTDEKSVCHAPLPASSRRSHALAPDQC